MADSTLEKDQSQIFADQIDELLDEPQKLSLMLNEAAEGPVRRMRSGEAGEAYGNIQ